MIRFHPYWLVACVLLLVGSLAAQQAPPAPAPAAHDQSTPDPLLDPPPLPRGKVTLIGGTVASIDRVRNRLTVQPFGTKKKMKLTFDERTRFYRDGVETTQLGVRKGDRVYADTQLDDTRVFARNLRVVTASSQADAAGQLVSFEPGSGELVLRDQLSSLPVAFQLEPGAAIRRGEAAVAASELRPGALVAVRFTPDGGRRLVRQVEIVAVPGSRFTFAGRVSHMDLRSGVLSIESSTDQKTYDIAFSPATPGMGEDLTVGAQVAVDAVFDGAGYKASSISVVQPSPE